MVGGRDTLYVSSLWRRIEKLVGFCWGLLWGWCWGEVRKRVWFWRLSSGNCVSDPRFNNLLRRRLETGGGWLLIKTISISCFDKFPKQICIERSFRMTTKSRKIVIFLMTLWLAICTGKVYMSLWAITIASYLDIKIHRRGPNVSFVFFNPFISVFMLPQQCSNLWWIKTYLSQQSRVVHSSLAKRLLQSLGFLGYKTYRHF